MIPIVADEVYEYAVSMRYFIFYWKGKHNNNNKQTNKGSRKLNSELYMREH